MNIMHCEVERTGRTDVATFRSVYAIISHILVAEVVE